MQKEKENRTETQRKLEWYNTLMDDVVQIPSRKKYIIGRYGMGLVRTDTGAAPT